MIEIFSRNPEYITLSDDAIFTPLPFDDEVSSLSAILLNEAYYDLLKNGQITIDGISIPQSFKILGILKQKGIGNIEFI